MTPEQDDRRTKSNPAKAAGEWIAVLVAWAAVLSLLLAIVAALLGEP